jgi:hypothetical protein
VHVAILLRDTVSGEFAPATPTALSLLKRGGRFVVTCEPVPSENFGTPQHLSRASPRPI